MSRKSFKLSDFDKYMKPMHLGGKQHQLTVAHIGVEPVKARRREWVIAGNAPDEQPDEFLLVLHFREWPKPLRVNNMNRAKLQEFIGDDPASLIGCKVTLRPLTLAQFGGQEVIDIVSVEKPKAEPAKPAESPEQKRAGLVKRLSELRQKEKALLAARGAEPTELTGEQVKAMTDEELEKRIELTENNIMDLQAA